MTHRSGNEEAAEHPGLALCNTVGPAGDALDSPAALARWFVETGLATGPPEVDPDDLEAARTLRDGLRAALVSGDTAGVAAIAERWLEGTPGCLCVERETLEPRFTPGDDGPRCLLVAAVLDALTLARESPARVRVCAATDCETVYLDTSRNRSRRWCSMERCGARAKASAYYRRRQGQVAGQS